MAIIEEDESETAMERETEQEPEEQHSARPYQVELLERAKKRNTIVCLGTGTGKTFISVMLIKELAHEVRGTYKKGGKRTFFLVNTGKRLLFMFDNIRGWGGFNVRVGRVGKGVFAHNNVSFCRIRSPLYGTWALRFLVHKQSEKKKNFKVQLESRADWVRKVTRNPYLDWVIGPEFPVRLESRSPENRITRVDYSNNPRIRTWVLRTC